MSVAAHGGKALLLLGLEQKIPGYQIGAPLPFAAPISGPSTAPTAAGGDPGNITGTSVSWKCSFVTISRGETECGPASTPLSLSAAQGALTDIPVSADSDVIGTRIYRQIDGGSWLHVWTLWDGSTSWNDNTAPGAEDWSISPVSANQTANNFGLADIPIDPSSLVTREDTSVTPNELTGTLGEPDAIPISTSYPIDLSGSLRAGHLVPFFGSFLALPVVTRVPAEPVFLYDFPLSDDEADSVSVWGLVHKGGASTRPLLFMGGKINSIDIASPGNAELGVKMKGLACADSESSPGYPDPANTGSYPFHPVLKGTRSDATAYSESVFCECTQAPADGVIKVTYKIGAAGTPGPELSIRYNPATGRQIRYGAQDEPAVEVLVEGGEPLGFDDGENREPVSIYFPGDLRAIAVGDKWEHKPECLIPEPRSGAAYSNQARLRTDITRFTPTRVSILRGESSVDSLLDFEAVTWKLSRTLAPRMGHGPAAKRPRDLILSGYMKIELDVDRWYDSREFERIQRQNKRFKLDLKIEGPRIVTNPGVKSTYRELIRCQVNRAQISKTSSPVTGPGPVKEKFSIVAKQPPDGSTPFSCQIVSTMGWNFTAIQ